MKEIYKNHDIEKENILQNVQYVRNSGKDKTGNGAAKSLGYKTAAKGMT